MKILSVAIPSYNSEDYLARAVESLLPAGPEIEILIVNDGSSDQTGAIAEEFRKAHPEMVQVIHQENGGHGDAVMTGLQHATGHYFKVLDSDDRIGTEALLQVLETLRPRCKEGEAIDLLVSNYVYDKVGVKHKRVISYQNALPENKVLHWDEVRSFRLGQYILMHACIYRTALLKNSGLKLPKHTFYVDSLYVYVPLPLVKRLYYLNVDLYYYFIGREDQSIQENIMIKRIDQQFKVNRLMSEAVDLSQVKDKALQDYMRNYLEVISTVSRVLSILSKDPRVLAKCDALWQQLQKDNPENYALIKYRPLFFLSKLPTGLGRMLVILVYRLARALYGFS